MANLLLINLFLTWSNRCFVIDNPIVGQEPTFTLTDTQLYVPVVTLSTHDNAKLLEQLKSNFFTGSTKISLCKGVLSFRTLSLRVTTQHITPILYQNGVCSLNFQALQPCSP